MTEKGCAREPPDFELIETYTGRARRMEILADDCCRYIEVIRALRGTRKDIRERCDGTIRSITKVMKWYKAEAAKARAAAQELTKLLPPDGVLYAYYARGLTWEQVADEKNHCLRYIYILRKKELAAFGIDEMEGDEERKLMENGRKWQKEGGV